MSRNAPAGPYRQATVDWTLGAASTPTTQDALNSEEVKQRAVDNPSFQLATEQPERAQRPDNLRLHVT